MNDEIFIDQEELGEEPKRRKLPGWSHWRRALKWLGICLGLVAVAAVAYLLFNLHKITPNIFSWGHLKGEDRGRINIMMLGVGDPGHDGADLSDTNILLSFDTKNHKIAEISIPRDIRVKIPGDGYNKINYANAQGGIPVAKQVFENTLGQPIDYYVKANFTGLKDVVDAVGGVDVDNTDLLSDPEYPCDSNQWRSCGYKLKPGHYHLDGTQALKYVRCRKGTCGDDFGRAMRQQQVMQSIRTKAASGGTLANPIALTKLIKAAGDNIQTDLSINNIMRLNELTKQVDRSSIFNIVFNLGPDGFLVTSDTSDLLPKDGNFSAIRSFVSDIFTRAPIWSEHPTVLIENGTTTVGVGAKFNQKLTNSSSDVSISGVTNALTRDYATTKIIDYTADKKPHTADYLKGLLKVQQVSAPDAVTKNPPADFVIILGSDYAASVAPATSSSSSTSAQ